MPSRDTTATVSESRGHRPAGGGSLAAALHKAGLESGHAPPQPATWEFPPEPPRPDTGERQAPPTRNGVPLWIKTARRDRWRARFAQLAAWCATLLVISITVATAAHFLVAWP